MNNPHQNAKTTVHSRALIVERRASGQTVQRIASDLGISTRTVFKWLSRHRQAGRAGLSNRPSAPVRRHGLGERERVLIAHLRRQHRLTGACIAARLGLARSTVARHLERAGIGRLARLDPPVPIRRYQRERPGELIHLDTKKLGRFERPGHRITGLRKGNRNRGAGWDYVHVAIDDATRLAYVEVLADERRHTATGFLLRALRWFRDQGIRVERVMTDNGSAYRSRVFRKTLRWLAIRHIFTRPYTPRTNGKAERFIQTLLREWAYANAYPTSNARNFDLQRWLDWYNAKRQHSALNGQPPFQALNNFMRNDT